MAEARESKSDCFASESAGTGATPTGNVFSIEAGAGSSGLRRLNKTLYPIEKGTFA